MNPGMLTAIAGVAYLFARYDWLNRIETPDKIGAMIKGGKGGGRQFLPAELSGFSGND